MKIAIISEYNKLNSIGGTEYYVNMLIDGMLQEGNEVLFITQKKKNFLPELSDNNKRCRTIYLSERKYAHLEINQQIVSSTWNEMKLILNAEQPDIIHVHTYSTFFNIRHFEECSKYFRRIIFTSHIPGHFCPKGDLIKFNQSPCDGIIYSRCAICLFSKGLKTGISNVVFLHHKKVLKRLKILDKLGVSLVCVSQFQKDHAIGNRFEKSNISVIRQAIHNHSNFTLESYKKEGDFTIGYLGRLSAEKGAAFLLDIIEQLLQQTTINFVLGIPKKNSDQSDIRILEELANKNAHRIKIMYDISDTDKALFFKGIDLLIIPSFCMETGPIVLLEALQYGKQVLGPDIGGPQEFGKEFPGIVSHYKWNDLKDAVGKILRISENYKPILSPRRTLEEKENDFISKHIELYKQLQNK